MKRGMFAAAGLLLLSNLAFAQKPKALKPGWNLFSAQQDVALGKEAAAEIEKKAAVVDNKDLADYLNRVGKRLTTQPEAGQFPYTFKVVYDKSINAFALPGGPAFVHTGLISQAENEAQLAGVLAHEISHVALRHGTSQVTKAQAVQVLAGLGGAMMGGGLLGQLAQMGAGLGANSLLLKFSRSAEADADLLGSRMMAKAGYDPLEMANFFARLEAEERKAGQSIPQFLSDHPSPGNRVKAVQAEIKLMPAREYTKGDAGELARAQSIIKGLPVPPKANTDWRNAGDTSTGRPSGQLKQYQGQGLSFSYPGNWEIFQQKQASEITVASREGIAEVNGNAEIAYGAIIGISQKQTQGNIDRDTDAFLQQMMQSNKSLQRGNEQPRRLQISGMPAMLHILFSPSPYKGQREVDAFITVQHAKGLFYMILISPESEYPKAQPIFEQMITSIKFN